MQIITRAAYFQPCLCGRHGAIVCTDGQAGYFSSKLGARDEMHQMHDRGWISDHEMIVVGQQILASKMPRDSNATNLCESMWEVRKYAVYPPKEQPQGKASPKPPPPAPRGYRSQRSPAQLAKSRHH